MMYIVIFTIIITTIYPFMIFSRIFVCTSSPIQVVHSFTYYSYTPIMCYGHIKKRHGFPNVNNKKYTTILLLALVPEYHTSSDDDNCFCNNDININYDKKTGFLNQAVVRHIDDNDNDDTNYIEYDGNDIDNDSTEPATQTTPPSTTTSKIPILFDSSNYLHRDIYYHPEQPERITVCVNALYNKYCTTSNKQQRPTTNNNNIVLIDVATEPLVSIIINISNDSNDITKATSTTSSSPYFMASNVHDESGIDDDSNRNNIQYESITANEYEYARSILLKTHQPELVSMLETKANLSKQQRIQDNKSSFGHMGSIDADTYITTESFNVCIRAAATWIRAINIVSGTYNNNNINPTITSTTTPLYAFALTRPPGHHATYTSSNGFCLYNFAAAAAIHYITKSSTNNNTKIPKVSIVDWDVHYGQGISDIIQNYSNIRYVSIHQTPAFPYMGEENTISGQYSNIYTIPIPPGTTFINQYKTLFQQALNFICTTSTGTAEDNDNDNCNDEWIPDIVIVCAGYDALDTDELANVNLQSKDYNTMTQMLCQHLQKTVVVRETTSSSSSSSSDSNVIDNNSNNKQRHRSIPIIFGLEGGYQLSTTTNFENNLQHAVIETIQGLSP